MRLVLERIATENRQICVRGSIGLRVLDWVFGVYKLHFVDVGFSQQPPKERYLWVFWDWNSRVVRSKNIGGKFLGKFVDISQGLRLDEVHIVVKG